MPSLEVKKRIFSKPRILVVDDEPMICELLGEVLSTHFEPLYASDGKEGFEVAKRELPDMILMDVMMPRMDGIEACRLLREEALTRHIPVMILTAADSVDSRIRAFDFGADDFIPKPFDVKELITRVQNKHKRSKEMAAPPENEVTIGNLILDLQNQIARVNGETLTFSPVEFDILKILVLNQNQLVSRKQILDKVWRNESTSDRVIDAHLVSLRKKIKDFNGKVKTVYGVGYMLTA